MKPIVLLAAVVPLVASPPEARAQFAYPKLILHAVVGSGLPADCSEAPVHPTCNTGGFPGDGQVTVNTHGDLMVDYRVYVLLADVDSLSGVKVIRFGISYEAGVTVSEWMSCAGEILTSETWPGSGSEVTVRFDGPSGCSRPTRDPEDQDHLGAVPVMVLTVRASAPALFRIVPTADEMIPLTNCEEETAPLELGTGLGELGFGYKVGWDPCNTYPFAEGCGVFFNCACCLSTSCRPIYDIRACQNEGGKVMSPGDCADCTAPTQTITWGTLKAFYR